MSYRKPVLMTGHRGYLGAVMAPHLIEQGYDVVGLDTGYFDASTLVPDAREIPSVVKDIRDLTPADVQDVWAVVHLAALSNDPLGDLDPTWTSDINHAATVRLAELARAAGVRRFLFSSSCIMYGMSEAEVVDETAPLAPRTDYARTKKTAEDALHAMASDRFSPVFIRNGTVYGLSPRMRLDTVLNDMVAQAVTSGVVQVFGDGTPWRLVVNVADVARSFARFLDAPAEVIHNEAFNNGSETLNHRVMELAEFAAASVEGGRVEVLDRPSADRRTYKADFRKFAAAFPDFEWRWTAAAGATDLAQRLRSIGFAREDYEGDRYVRLRTLRRLIDAQALDGQLRWTATGQASEQTQEVRA